MVSQTSMYISTASDHSIYCHSIRRIQLTFRSLAHARVLISNLVSSSVSPFHSCRRLTRCTAFQAAAVSAPVRRRWRRRRRPLAAGDAFLTAERRVRRRPAAAAAQPLTASRPDTGQYCSHSQPVDLTQVSTAATHSQST